MKKIDPMKIINDLEDNYRVYMVALPGDIKGAVRVDNDGFVSIYINDCLSPKAKRDVFLHELRHIYRNDFYNVENIRSVES